MPKPKFEVGGELTIRLDITRYKDGLVTVQFGDGKKVTISEDDPDIVSVEPAPKVKERLGKIGTSKLAKILGDEE